MLPCAVLECNAIDRMVWGMMGGDVREGMEQNIIERVCLLGDMVYSLHSTFKGGTYRYSCCYYTHSDTHYWYDLTTLVWRSCPCTYLTYHLPSLTVPTILSLFSALLFACLLSSSMNALSSPTYMVTNPNQSNLSTIQQQIPFQFFMPNFQQLGQKHTYGHTQTVSYTHTRQLYFVFDRDVVNSGK